jgi:hypothetical protein
MIEFACHQCKTRLKVKASAAGQTVACPRCQTALTIPGDKSAPSAPVKPVLRHPLGDPPPGESADPTQRVVELTALNRELQEKLRRKETELELARLKIAHLAKSAPVEPPAVPEPASPAPPLAVPAVEPPALVAVVPAPAQPTLWWWGIRVVLIIVLAVVALLIWRSGRRSSTGSVPVSAEQSAPISIEPKGIPEPPVQAHPTPAPQSTVAPTPVEKLPEPIPSPVKESEPPKSDPPQIPADVVPSAPSLEPTGATVPVPPAPVPSAGVSP